MKYSIIVPAYNEKESLEELLRQINKVTGTLKGQTEIIVVDDGSKDKSLDLLKKIKRSYKNLKVLSFRKNYGKSTALLAGFDKAKGEIVVTVDADLQDDPAEIRKLASKLNEGYGAVSGWRRARNDNLIKKLSSILFNLLVSKTTGLTLHDFNCGLKAYKREALSNVNLAGGMHRFIPLLVYWQGYEVSEVAVSHRKRYSGESKYGKFGFSRILKSLFDLSTIILLQKYGKRPMRLFGLIGILFSILGFIAGTYLVFLKMQGQAIGDRPLLILAVLLMVLGTQFFSLGFLGELFALNQKDDMPKAVEI